MPEEPAVGDADAAAMLGAKLIEASGMDAAALLAALDANRDAVIAALQGGGTVDAAALSTDVVTATLSNALKVAQVELSQFRARDKAAADAKVAAEIGAEVETLIKAGKVLPSKRAEMVALGRKAPAQFRALTAVLAPGAEFPAGAEASALAPIVTDPTAATAPLDMSDPRVVSLSAALDRAGVKDTAIRERQIRASLARTNPSAG
jgi:hypothetical protein